MSNIRHAAHYPECHEGVTRRGEFQPCENVTVALRYDEEGTPYPVCKRHARGRMVPLAEVIAALQPLSALAEFDPCHGGDEQNARHATVCVPFYVARAKAIEEGVPDA